MIVLNTGDYRDKVLGCWMGKNIGGTLGAPFEWKRQKNDVSFYVQESSGQPLPNDDLDIQLLWLVALEEHGVHIDAQTLGAYWMMFVTPHWAEYGIAKTNMKAGLPPPLSGMANNPYKDSCGAFIRSEIWACIAPALPDVAARYAYEDAIIDHGDGEGMYAEVFCAALESAAFIESDIDRLIEIGLSYIPGSCGVARAARAMVGDYRAGKSWEEARDHLLREYRGRANEWGGIAQEDRDKGFADGPLGWDAPSNIGIVVIGLLYGAGDFQRSLCVAVNCGEDTDCTGATVGSMYGIIHGAKTIPERWLEPIGRGIKTGTLNLGELGYYGDQLPATLDVLTDRVTRIAQQVILARNLPVTLVADCATAVPAEAVQALPAADAGLSVHGKAGRTEHTFDSFSVQVDYAGKAVVRPGEPKRLQIFIENRYRTPELLRVRWYGPDGCTILPAHTATVFVPSTPPRSASLQVDVVLEKVESTNRLVAEISVNGRSTVMLVPVVLLQE